jgi:hypothetical protein
MPRNCSAVDPSEMRSKAERALPMGGAIDLTQVNEC